VTETSPESGYLDAARDCIVQVGWRRTTLTDIARKAGVSRMTIYRRWPDMQTLLADLLVREWSELLLDSGLAGGDAASTREQLAQGITGMVGALRENALFLRIIEVDPELLHPYLFERIGRNQKWILELTEEYVRTGQADGSVRAGDPHVLAHALLLTTYGFVLSAHTLDVPAEELDTELRALVERYLTP
jgi:AcrR family transcriptional regulator